MTVTDTTRWEVSRGPAGLNIISSVAIASIDKMAARMYRVSAVRPRVAKYPESQSKWSGCRHHMRNRRTTQHPRVPGQLGRPDFRLDVTRARRGGRGFGGDSNPRPSKSALAPTALRYQAGSGPLTT